MSTIEYLVFIAAVIIIPFIMFFALGSQNKKKQQKYRSILEASSEKETMALFKGLVSEMQPPKKGFTLSSTPPREPIPSSDMECHKLFHQCGSVVTKNDGRIPWPCSYQLEYRFYMKQVPMCQSRPGKNIPSCGPS